MLELYQFEISQYSEKVRLILDYKGLEYKKIEVTPGVGQLEVYKLSGQRQVPILKDGDTVIADSTEIALYLDRKYPEKPILPSDPVQRGQCLLIEELADESIGSKGRQAFLGALNKNATFRKSILPKQTPDVLKNLIGAVPGEFLDLLGSPIGAGGYALKEAERGLKQDLDALTLILEKQPYLVTDHPTLADLAVAGLSIILKMPGGNYLDIPDEFKGKGIPGIADNSAYEAFFTWRDRIYEQYRQSSSKPTTKSNSNPTTIEIE
jgi:glutathione S-transferase